MFRRVSSAAVSVASCNTAMRQVASEGVTCKVKDQLVRNPSFKVLDEEDVAFFKSVMPAEDRASGVITDSEALKPLNADWFQHYRGESKCAVLPKTTEQVMAIMKYCHSKNIAVVPQGGNTNFVGGANPCFDEVILGFSKMNKVSAVDTISSTVTCGAGCILENLDIHLKEKYNLMMPVDLGAKGSCHIGGNVSTNAGGIRFMRYGSLHNAVIGLRVVLANGEELDMLHPRKKDNTGYDLKHLFIGSEGTLGLVTEVSLQLPTNPNSIETMFLGLPNWQSVLDTYQKAKKDLGEILSAVEMIDGDALEIVTRVDKSDSPLGVESEKHRYYLLLETNGSNNDHDKAKLEAFLESAMEENLVVDGTLAASTQQSKHIWSMREGCAVAPNALGHVRWYDISMPTPMMEDLVLGTRKVLADNGFGKDVAEVIAFGHLGDGNLHANVVTKDKYRPEVFDVVDPFIYGYSKERGLSVSAEHGIGVQKLPYLSYSKSGLAIAKMKALKQAFDPSGILNPYKVL